MGRDCYLSYLIGQLGGINFGGSECDFMISTHKHGEAIAVISVGNDEECRLILSRRFPGQAIVNGAPLSMGCRSIRSGDRIQFVSAPSKLFILKHVYVNLLFSSMGKQAKKKAKSVAALIHANVLSEWSKECDLLVMSSLIVTSKVVCALLHCIPIVTPEFLEEIKQISTCKFAAKPDPQNFLPVVKEEKLTQNDAPRFLPNELRRDLFHGKTFFVFSKDKYDRLVEIIHLGNGKIYLLDSCDTLLTLAAESDVYASGDFAVNDILRDVLSKSGSCVIHLHPTSLTQQWQRKVYSVLRSLNQRPILESELGFAVIYCSTELYCNPRKHCPDGLYQEVNVSEAFSVNPFQIDSEVLTSQTNELCNTVNGLEVSSSFKKNSSLKTNKNESTTGQKSSLFQTTESNENKGKSTVSKIVPLVTPERKTPGGLLVQDSEPAFSPKFANGSRFPPMGSENQEPHKPETVSKKTAIISNTESSFVHQPSEHSDYVLKLFDSIPRLELPKKKSVLSESTNKGQSSVVQSSPRLSSVNCGRELDSVQCELSASCKDSVLPVVAEKTDSSDAGNCGPNDAPLKQSDSDKMVSDKLGRLLVQDSEPVFSQEFVNQSRFPSLGVENQETYKSETVSKKTTVISNTESSFVHQPSEHSDYVLKLFDSIPRLELPKKKSVLSESTNKGQSSVVQSSPRLSSVNCGRELDSVQCELSASCKDSVLPVVAEKTDSSDAGNCGPNDAPLKQSNSDERASDGWLRKRVGVETDSPDNNNQCAKVAPMTITTNVPKFIASTQQNNKRNFKQFVKVWPTHLRRNTQLRPSIHPCVSRPIPLAPFHQTLEKKREECKTIVKSKNSSEDERRERINKLFEECCEPPPLRKFRTTIEV
uniref:Nibrin second BRCT domain-containing protein n=1 Tax=Trichobilharzia regenti TaxID=157069 RepID=A0AA85JVL7_TRIRE|nr:unnamed protein product [Trichobilharzia regenti]